VNKYLLLILVTLVVTTILIGFTTSFNTEKDYIYHWLPFIWLSVLIFLNWYVAGKITSTQKSKNMLFGILPIAGLSLTVGSILSATLLFVYSSEGFLTSTFHLISQTLIISITIIFLFLYKISSNAAEINVSAMNPQKNDCLKMIRSLVTSSSAKTKENLEKIVNIIEYDLPHDSKLQRLDEWIQFTNDLVNKSKDPSSDNSFEIQSANWLENLKRIQ
tara:strand:+ start:1287 stop:1940 length:654 start_codon:yes stop_codon:yes gene_type:complete